MGSERIYHRMVRHSRQDALEQSTFEDLVDSVAELYPPFDAECMFVLFAGGRLGMRAGEIAHIAENWVNWERSLIQIPTQDPCTKGEDGSVCGYCRKRAEEAVRCNDELSMEDALAQRWEPKTSHGARSIPFDWSEQVESVVEAFFDRYDEYPASRVSVNRRVTRAAEAAGHENKRIYPHCLRATAATKLAYKGVPAVALQSLFGWAQLSTAQKYVRVSGGATQDALNEVFGQV